MGRTLSELKKVVPQPANQILDDIALVGDSPTFASEVTFSDAVNIDDSIVLKELVTDPAAPAAGYGVLWMAEGTGTGSEGDLIFKWRNAADDTTTTETITKA